MIETERFLLKKLTVNNASDQYLNWFKDKDIKKYILSTPKSTYDLVDFIMQCNAHDLILLLGIFTKGGQHIGNIKFEFNNESKKEAVMGIIIGPTQWRGKQVASEVINESSQYLNEMFATNVILLGVNKSNTSAIKLYEKIGFKREVKFKDSENSDFIMALNLISNS